MKLTFALLSLFLLAPEALAEPIAFMLNMNYSSNELAALKDVAKKRGQKVFMVPPERLIPIAEKLFSSRDDLEKKIRALRPACPKGEPANPTCFTPPQVRMIMGDIMLKGSGSARLGPLEGQFQTEINDVHGAAQALAAEEEKLPPIEQQMQEKIDELSGQGKTFDTVVISAHSDGSNLSGESTNRISSSGVNRLAKKNPHLFKDPRHVLLLGCYNMTSTHHQRWRHNLFSNASLLAGFGKRAPSRNRPVSAQFIRETLNTADKLDDKLIANPDIDRGVLERVFKALPSVANTQSVIDYCLDIIEGQKGAAKLSCDEQWNDFKERVDLIQAEYLDLRDPKSDPPPEVDGNDLRDFYNDIQGMCSAKDASNIPRNQVASAESYRVAIREMTIRLVYWSNVQQNYGTYFAREIASLNRSLREAGIRMEIPPLDGGTGRVEFVKKYVALEAGLERAINNRSITEGQRRSIRQAQSMFAFLKPLYTLEGEDSVGESELSAESTLAQGGIPFYWHEVGVVKAPRSSR